MCASKGDPRDDQPDLKLLCMSCVSNIDVTQDQEKQSSTSWHNSLRATHQHMSTGLAELAYTELDKRASQLTGRQTPAFG